MLEDITALHQGLDGRRAEMTQKWMQINAKLQNPDFLGKLPPNIIDDLLRKSAEVGVAVNDSTISPHIDTVKEYYLDTSKLLSDLIAMIPPSLR